MMITLDWASPTSTTMHLLQVNSTGRVPFLSSRFYSKGFVLLNTRRTQIFLSLSNLRFYRRISYSLYCGYLHRSTAMITMMLMNARRSICNLGLGRGAVSACVHSLGSIVNVSLVVWELTRWVYLEEGVEIVHLDAFEHDTSRSWWLDGRLLRYSSLRFLMSSRNAASSFLAFFYPFRRVFRRDSHLSCVRAIVRKYISIEGSTIIIRASSFQCHSYRL